MGERTCPGQEALLEMNRKYGKTMLDAIVNDDYCQSFNNGRGCKHWHERRCNAREERID